MAVWKFLAGAWLVLACSGAWSCQFWQTVGFPDGTKSCLTDFGVGRAKVPEIGRAVADAVPRVGVYVLAASFARTQGAVCPAATGMSVFDTANTANATNQPNLDVRVGQAVLRCEAALVRAGGGPGCGCEPVVVDGAASVPRETLAALAESAPAPARPVVQPVAAARSSPLPASPDQAPLRCDFWQAITFRDGQRACLPEFPIANAVSPELGRSLADSVPRVGAYVVAAARKAGQACPAVIGLSSHRLDATTSHNSLPPLGARVAEALQRCQAAARAAGGARECECEPVLVDGNSTLTRDAFADLGTGRMAPRPVAAARPAVPAPAPAPVPTAERPAPGTPAAAEAATARLVAELAQMRAQLDAMERSRAVPAASPSRPDAAPRLTARALVIGNSAYSSFAALPNPRNDARAMAAKLRSFNIEVDLVLDADRDALVKALNDYAARAAGRDVNILFYAGHGVQVEGINYLVPTNMRADGISAGYVKLAGISLNAALDYLPAHTRLVFLDACRDNPASRSLVATRSGRGLGLAPTTAATGTLIAYATKDGATAEDGGGGNSPYTAALLAHLDAPQDISLVLRQVRQSVMRATGNRQEPWEYGSLVGEQLVLSRMARP